MQLSEYITNRLDDNETEAVVQGLQNNLHTDLAGASANIPRKDWSAEITNKSRESDGQTLIWLSGQADPSYSIQQ